MKNKILVLLLIAIPALKATDRDDLRDAIKKSDKKKVVQISKKMHRSPSTAERALAKEMINHRLEKKDRLPEVHHEIAESAVLLGSAASALIFACIFSVGLGVDPSEFLPHDSRNHHVYFHGLGDDIQPNAKVAKVGGVGLLLSSAALAGGITWAWLDIRTSQLKASRKYSAACYIDDLFEGRRSLSDDDETDDGNGE